MSWLVVARKDFRDSVRSRWLLGLSAVFVGLVTLSALALSALPPGFINLVLLGRLGGDVVVDSRLVLLAMNGIIITPLVPLIALVMAHAAVSGERETGSLKVLLSLPHSRSDVVFGKVLGRSAAMGAAIVLGFLLPGLVMAIFVPFQAVEYFGFVALTVLLATVFISIAVGISASVETQWRAQAISLAFYLVFITFWAAFQIVGGFAIGLLAGGWPGWMPLGFEQTLRILRVVNPTGAFKILSGNFLAGTLFGPQADPNLQFSALTMLVFWLVAPMLVGIWRFETTDL